MNSFLVQVNPKGYDTIIQNCSYSNEHWEKKSEGYTTWRNKDNIDHGKVKSGDQLVLYCTSTVHNEAHKKKLAFSVIVSSVSADRTTFEVGEPQFFQDPLELKDIRNYIEQGKLDKCFGNCGREGFNITELEPTAEQQLFDLVGLQIPLCQARQQNALRRVWRAVLVAVRHLRRRFQRRDRGGEA